LQALVVDVSDPQRTHAPTPKRVRDFRKRGDIALSRELVSGAALVAGGCTLVGCGAMTMMALCDLARHAAITADGRGSASLPGVAASTFLTAVGPVLVVSVIAAALTIMGQVGWPPAWKKIGFDLTRLNPVANLRLTFSPRAMGRKTLATIAKLIGAGAVVAIAIRPGLAVPAMGAGEVAEFAGRLAVRALFGVIAVLGILAVVDYVLARRRIMAQMRMTPDEVRREMREQDGDPQLKGRRRQRMRELAKRRIALEVAKADVVVVNPTHYAVALRYNEHKDHAPVVVAKGVDELAAKIREVARQHGVVVVSRPPLARALYATVKEGRAVPVSLYRAVAEILAYVYRLRRGVA